MNWNDLILGSTAQGELICSHYEKFGLSKHSTIHEISKAISEETFSCFFKFALVRNPVARICSLYNFLGSIVYNVLDRHGVTVQQLRDEVRRGDFRIPELRWYSCQAFMEEGFSQFIRNKTLFSSDLALRPQVESLTIDGKICVDSFFKLEEIRDAIPLISSKIGFDFQMPHENRSEKIFIRPDDLVPADIEFIKSAYIDDYKLLGY